MDKEKDFDYTIVMDASYTGPKEEDLASDIEATESGATSDRKAADLLYSEYEKMCYKLPTVLDADDAYPHSYQWRIVDRYDPAKVVILKEALAHGMKIADTEAYAIFAEEIKTTGFTPDSWE